MGASQVSLVVKNQPTNAGNLDAIPRSGQEDPLGVEQPTPVFLPGEPHGQKSLVGYSP